MSSNYARQNIYGYIKSKIEKTEIEMDDTCIPSV